MAFRNQPGHPIVMRALPFSRPASEEDLAKSDKELIREVSTLASAVAYLNVKNFLSYMFLAAAMVTPSSATTTSSTTSTTTTRSNDTDDDEPDFIKLAITVICLVIFAERMTMMLGMRALRTLWGHWQRSEAPTSTTSSTMEATDMDVDEANIGRSEEEEEELAISPGDMDDETMCVPDGVFLRIYEQDQMINYLKACEKRLEKEIVDITHISDVKNHELIMLRRMRDEHYRTIERMDQDIRRGQANEDLSRSELFATTATCRTWHKSRDCNHLRGTQFSSHARMPRLRAMISPGNASGVKFLESPECSTCDLSSQFCSALGLQQREIS